MFRTDYFSGREYYEHRRPCDATQIGRFRRALGEAGVEELLKTTIEAAVAMKAIRPAEFERVIVDSTVQPKAIAYPVDARLLEIARNQVVKAARAASCGARPADTPMHGSSNGCARCYAGSARCWGG